MRTDVLQGNKNMEKGGGALPVSPHEVFRKGYDEQWIKTT